MPTHRVSQQASRQLRTAASSSSQQKRARHGGIAAFLMLIVAGYALLVMLASLHVQGPNIAENKRLPHGIRKSGVTRSSSKREIGGQTKLVEASSATSTEANVHILFSTSCSDSQDWQSYLFFYQMMKMNQRGNVTRIVAGCTPQQEEHQRAILHEIQSTMSPRFNTYFIEKDFGKLHSMGGGDWHTTKYFNKPFGTKDFMEQVLGYPDSHEHDEDLIVLMDPDMFLLQPFVNDFTKFLPETQEIRSVSHGHMFGQPFGYRSAWYTEAKDNLTYILQSETSPVYNLTGEDLLYYHAGPPYMGTGKDFYNLIKTWCDILPRYQALRRHFMVEMYSASMAAAHLSLPFHLVSNFMISDHGVNNEGWSGIDNAEPTDLCTPNNAGVKELPLVFHYCQRFGLGEYFFNKHIFAKHFDFFSCDEQLLNEPPANVSLAYNFSHYGDGSTKKWFDFKFVKRNAFMLCSMTSALNDAVTFYKTHHCTDSDASYSKTWMWHDAAKGSTKKPFRSQPG